MKLLIVESPKKCETIRRYLGKDYEVMASKGHIRDLSTRGKGGLGIDTDHGYKIDWVISKDSYLTVKQLTEASKKAEEVYLATDPDREGEAIAFALLEVLHLPKNTKRLEFHEITRPEITKAMENPRTLDMNLVDAQEVRRMIDRIIGFKISPLFQKKAKLKSAGRVQSSTLRLIVDRQEEIDNFVPEEYWTISITLNINGNELEAKLAKVDGKQAKIRSKEEADAILARIPSSIALTSLDKKVKQIAPKYPLTTSTMQQEAYNRYHFSNKLTQSLAQSLYDGKQVNGEHVGLITYIRTDSNRISPEFFSKHAKPYISETYGLEYVGILREGKETKLAQDAHEAIRPTGCHRTPESVRAYLTNDEYKLYTLIYERAIASLMAFKKVEETNCVFSANGLEFNLTLSKTLFDGFSKLSHSFIENEVNLSSNLKKNQIMDVQKINPEQKFTKSEPPYNEASIVKAMEENGIGRPSTYATTIDTLINHHYVTATKGVLSPTDDGKKAIILLKKYFPEVADVNYTSDMEKDLDKVEEGSTKRNQVMDSFFEDFCKTVEEAKKKMYSEPDIPTGENCPVCGKPLVYKHSKNGNQFIACSGYPNCNYIKHEEKVVEEVGRECPKCGKPLIYKYSRSNKKFIGCSAYPNCDYTEDLKKARKATNKKVYTEADYVKECPQCHQGHLVIRKSKKGNEFLGCTNFPKCRYIEDIKGKKE